MKKLKNALTEDDVKKIEKKNNLFTKDVISLNDKKKRRILDSYAYQEYLKKLNNESSDFNGKK